MAPDFDQKVILCDLLTNLFILAPNISNAPPPMKVIRAMTKKPLVASTANEWTDVKMPERTRKRPKRHNINVRMPRKTVHILNISFFSRIFKQ